MKFFFKWPVAVLLLTAWFGVVQVFAVSIEADVVLGYSPDAATRQGGEDNIQLNLANALMGANALHEQSGTGVRWRIAGYVQSSANPVDQDNNYILGLVSGDAAYADVRNYATSVGADLVSYFHHGTGAAGNAYQPGNYSAMQEQWLWLVVVAHELGHNYGGNHADDRLSPKGIMMHNYCGGGSSWPYFYSSPNIWQDGVQLIGDGTCAGSQVNGGDNAWTICSQAQSHADIAARVSLAPNITNVVLRWCFTNAAAAAPASTTNYDLISGAPAVVRGVSASYTGKALRIPGGTTGNVAVNSMSAYIDLPNGIISSRTNITIEIWATPLSAPNWSRLCDFGRTVQAGNGAAGEWTGAPGSAAPGVTQSSDDLMLSFSIGTDLGAQRFESKLDGANTVTLDSGLPGVAGVQHHYTITFTDGAGSYGAAGGRWQWYRDAEPIAFLDVNYHLASLEDVNNWLGRSLWSSDSNANVDFAEVRISNVALTRGQILANYLLGPNCFPNANVALNANDAFGTTSFNAAGNWSSGAVPSAGNRYETYGSSLRTPPTASAYTFAGDALTVSGGTLLWKGTSGSSIITMNNLILNNGRIANAGSGTFTLAGSLKLTTDNLCSSVNGGTTISAALSGNGSISYLLNTATLTGNNSNFTGKTFVGCGAAGGLTIDSEARLGANPPAFTPDQLTLNRGWLYTTTTMTISNSNRGVRIGPSGGIFNVAAGTTLTLASPVSSAPTASTGIIAGMFIKDNSGTLLVTSPSNSHSGPIQVNAGTFNISSAGRLGNGSYAGPIANNAAFVYSSSATQTLSGAISGTGSLNKSGTGFLTLSGANTLSGAVTVNGGTLYANSANAANNRAFSYVSGITVNSGATLRASANALFGWDNTQEKPITVNLGGTLTANGGLSSDVGVGAVTLAGGTLATLAGGATDFGSWRFDNAGDKLIVTQNSTVSAFDVKFANGGAIDVTAGRTLNFTGTIIDTTGGGASSLVKSGGAGTLVLAGANTYSGSTTISNGMVLVSGSLGSGAVNVLSGATLGGIGSMGGTVSVESGGTLSPGTSLGVLTVNNSVTLNPGSTTFMEINNSPLTNDQLRVTGVLNLGGTLTVSNLGGPLVAGDSFTLFAAGSTTGSFAATNLPALNSGLVWNFNAAAGALSVVPTVATNPTNIAFVLGGGDLSLSWPADHTGWRLQTQTNPQSVGLSSNWFEVTGSAATNTVTVPADAANGSVFYRLVYP